MELRPNSPRKYVDCGPSTIAPSVARTSSCRNGPSPSTRARVRHLWQCDACGYQFETLVYLAEA